MNSQNRPKAEYWLYSVFEKCLNTEYWIYSLFENNQIPNTKLYFLDVTVWIVQLVYIWIVPILVSPALPVRVKTWVKSVMRGCLLWPRCSNTMVEFIKMIKLSVWKVRQINLVELQLKQCCLDVWPKIWKYF